MGRTCCWYWARIEAGGTAAFDAVAGEAALQAERVGSGDEEAQVVERVDVGPVEGKEALDEQEIGGGEALLGRLARVGGKVVHGNFDAVAGGELAEISGEAMVIHGLGGVEVDAGLLRLGTGRLSRGSTSLRRAQ